MKKISIAALAVISLTVTLIAAIPKKEIKQPPDFQTAFNAFGDALDNYISAKGTSDTIAAKAALLTAGNYISSHWSDQQVTDNVALYWPNPVGVVAACVAHCRSDYYSCMNHIFVSPGEGTCDEDYEDCKSHCHY